MRAGMEERTMSRLGSVLKLEATRIIVSISGDGEARNDNENCELSRLSDNHVD